MPQLETAGALLPTLPAKAVGFVTTRTVAGYVHRLATIALMFAIIRGIVG